MGNDENDPAFQAKVADLERSMAEASFKRAVERSRYAKQNRGEPNGAWSMGEKLLNALVFMRPDQLAALDYTEDEAIDRLRFDFAASTEQFQDVLARIRRAL